MNEIKPIRTEAEYEAAVDEIDELMEAEEGTPEADRLEVLAILVDAYETANDPIAPPDPIEAILFALDQEQITKKQLELALGGRNRMSEVLARRRRLSISMIRELANLGLPLRSLVGESRLSAPKKAARKASASRRTPKPTAAAALERKVYVEPVPRWDGLLADEKPAKYRTSKTKPRSASVRRRLKRKTKR